MHNERLGTITIVTEEDRRGMGELSFPEAGLPVQKIGLPVEEGHVELLEQRAQAPRIRPYTPRHESARGHLRRDRVEDPGDEAIVRERVEKSVGGEIERLLLPGPDTVVL